MRLTALVVLSLTMGLGACSVIGIASDAVSVTGTVVSTAARATADAAGAAVHAVTSSDSDDEKKSQ